MPCQLRVVLSPRQSEKMDSFNISEIKIFFNKVRENHSAKKD